MTGPLRTLRGSANKASRRGAVLMLILVCLLLLTMTTGVLLRAAMLHREHTHTALPQSQARWLAHAAAEAATVQLKGDASWSGESWTVSAEELGGSDAARLTVAVSQAPGRPGSRLVAITVDYPPDDPHRAHVEQQLRFDLPTN